MSAPRSPRIPVEERLFSLILALIATERGLQKTEILSSVQGYRQKFEGEGESAALDRLFERDKDDIRELGIPLEVIDVHGSGDNHELHYRIPKSAYNFPSDVRFSSQELAILKLAGTVWREGSLSRDSRRAIMKLRSLGVDADDPLLGYAPRLRTREAAFAPLSAALEKGLVVSFDYLKPGEVDALPRTVAPHALVYFNGFWHLYGMDESAEAMRTFLLVRIVGAVRTTRRRTRAHDPGVSEQALAGLESLWESQVAQVRVKPRSEAALHFAHRFNTPPSQAVFDIHYTDLHLLADEVASFGPEVLVVDPPELVVAVKERLGRVVGAHGGYRKEEPVVATQFVPVAEGVAHASE